ncbi:ankyrin [Thecamonas trahens ATCC 50062]|uniref:Palmitoyltransferase n=1 Tax=Thecamonas trahens ATCC 50062 TaxID=461836 RepID=A0A0L0DRM6_THETB|nr:ankyrin [Thecamonas trahens ATCC 50062]KNC54073.1 ankyrin [Thecamonas trahens ATCC 50062]|eukprot:XP_013754082.1 ankyrin [Thecamonas trahens ATCC 50062]
MEVLELWKHLEEAREVAAAPLLGGRGADDNAYFTLYTCDSTGCYGNEMDDDDDGSVSTLLHAAARDGEMDVLFFLVRVAGWSPSTRDAFGGTPLHEAMFYGRTMAATWLIGEGAKVDAVDRAGNTPLHLAVLARQSKCLRRVLSDCESIPRAALVTVASDEGRSVLDLARDMQLWSVAAVIAGYLADRETAEVLAKEHTAPDALPLTMVTPTEVASLPARAARAASALAERCAFSAGVLLLGFYLAVLHLPFVAALFGVVLTVGAGVIIASHLGQMPTAATRYVFVVLNNIGFASSVAALLSYHNDDESGAISTAPGFVATALVWAAYATACFADPGVLPPADAGTSDEAAMARYVQVLETAPDSVMGFCNTCRIPRPIRSKHCADCGVCVDVFDHHCVWLGNCVGAGNHRAFLLAMVLYEVAAMIVLPIELRILTSGWCTSWLELLPHMLESHPLLFGLFTCQCYGVIFVIYLVIPQIVFVTRNVTFNETVSGRRYNYLRDPESRTPLKPFAFGNLVNSYMFAVAADRKSRSPLAPAWLIALQSRFPALFAQR